MENLRGFGRVAEFGVVAWFIGSAGFGGIFLFWRKKGPFMATLLPKLSGSGFGSRFEVLYILARAFSENSIIGKKFQIFSLN